MHDTESLTYTNCGNTMENLLSISSCEYEGGLASGWYSTVERIEQARDGPDITLGDSETMVMFVSRQCADRPIRGRLA